MVALEKSVEHDFVQDVPQDVRIQVRPIDLVHLARQSLGDPGLESEILLMFDQMVLTHMSRIRETTEDEIILCNLHSIKGAAAGVGATSVAMLARAAEEEMRTNKKISHESLADLRMAVEEARHYIAEVLGD